MSITRVLQIQAVAFAVYGVAFFLIPEQVNEGIFGWAGADPILGRVIGATFIGAAWIEVMVAQGIETSPKMAYPFALIPILIVIAFVWERVVDTYGSDLWWWTNFLVALAFALLVGGAALAANRR